MWRLPWFRPREAPARASGPRPAEPSWQQLAPLRVVQSLQPVIEAAAFERALTASQPIALVDGVAAASRLGNRRPTTPRAPQVFAAGPRWRLPVPTPDLDSDAGAPPIVVRRAVEQETGSSLADVRVRRGREARAVTEPLRARAATVAEEVFIPDVAGSLTIGPGAALLAHELVHVAQQRRHGPTLADTAVGPRLEGEARGVEQRVALSSNGPGSDAGPRAASAWFEPLSELPIDPAPIRHREVVGPEPPMYGVQPVDEPTPWPSDTSADQVASHDTVSTVPPFAEPPAPDQADTAMATPDPRPATVSEAGAVHPQPFGTSSAPGPVPVPAAPRVATVQGASAAGGPASPNPHAELDELARRLYPSLRDRLKAELRLDRERAGRITDLPE